MKMKRKNETASTNNQNTKNQCQYLPSQSH